MFDHIIIIAFDASVLKTTFATWSTRLIWDGNCNLLQVLFYMVWHLTFQIQGCKLRSYLQNILLNGCSLKRPCKVENVQTQLFTTSELVMFQAQIGHSLVVYLKHFFTYSLNSIFEIYKNLKRMKYLHLNSHYARNF